ncbi:hypothetical protein GPECTOR_93g621 [Gonium pectorale]|uniref:Uncharacterized protein n=1 Tax=Gonium pectorale TaxID=33097 RepID=A0A150G0J8_GONPE|nr:hypothetical protein GPECTOR_93g621 [Gonium pectorale]|eukprot:KXZ43351.1 hypothetical protein GPECTOR_93g621 [Gonium pectorale]
MPTSALDEPEENRQPEGVGDVAEPDAVLSEFSSKFLDKLSKLTEANDLVFTIELLDMALENPDEAVNVILQHVKQCPPEHRLPALMLLDFMHKDDRRPPATDTNEQISAAMLQALTFVVGNTEDMQPALRMACWSLAKKLDPRMAAELEAPAGGPLPPGMGTGGAAPGRAPPMPAGEITAAEVQERVAQFSGFASSQFLDKLRKLTGVNQVTYAIKLLDMAMENPNEAANVILQHIKQCPQEHRLPALMLANFMFTDNRRLRANMEQISGPIVEALAFVWDNSDADKRAPLRFIYASLAEKLDRSEVAALEERMGPAAAAAVGRAPPGPGGVELSAAEVSVRLEASADASRPNAGPATAVPPQLSEFGRAFLDKLHSLTSWTDLPYARELRDLVLGQPEEAAHVVGALRQHVRQEQRPLEARVAALYLMSVVLKAEGCPAVLTEQLSAAFHEMFNLVWDAADDEDTRARLRLIVSYVATNPELRSMVALEEHIVILTSKPTEPTEPIHRDVEAAAASQQRVLKDTTLMLAAKQGHVGIAAEMIKEGADPDVNDEDKRTPIHNAASKGHPEVVKELLAAGADVKAATRGGRSPFYAAASYGRLEVVKVLLAAGADVNAATPDKRTPLHAAASNGHLEVVTELLAAGADVNAADNAAWTPLHDAASKGHLEVVKDLLAAGADVKTATKVVKELLAAGADLNAADKDKRTPLYVATSNGHLEVVKVLLAAGADVNAATTAYQCLLPSPSYAKQMCLDPRHAT